MLGALNAYDNIYFVNIITGFLNVLNQLKEPLIDEELCVLLSKRSENGISRDFGSEIHVLSSTMETFLALK